MGRTLTLVPWLLLALGGCGHGGAGQDCPLGCEGDELASLDLSCAPNDLTSVVASGPCAEPDASLNYWTGVNDHGTVFVGSRSPGTCHVVLTFATGFTYWADLTFVSRAQGCGCPNYVAPTTGPIMVNNPGSTCVSDAG